MTNLLQKEKAVASQYFKGMLTKEELATALLKLIFSEGNTSDKPNLSERKGGRNA